MTYKVEAPQSTEEEWVIEWCEELKDYGYIDYYKIHPKPFILSNTIKTKKVIHRKTLPDKVEYVTFIDKHIYTCDIKIKWNKDAYGLLCIRLDEELNYTIKNYIICNANLISFLEVKPVFDQNNMTREFSINRKWIYDKYKHLINLVIPTNFNKPRVNLFQKTFVPYTLLHTLVYKRESISNKGKKKEKINKVGDSKFKFKITTLQEYITKQQELKEKIL